jgi:pyrimidine-nucleoside phosphorylase
MPSATTAAIHPIDVILHKRDGLALTDAEIDGFVRAIVERNPDCTQPQIVTDAQIAALLMAIFQRGLNPQELATLTRAMRFSGETFDAKPLHTFTIDKHSTGGVGDKTSLLIAPILAAAGAELVPSISVPMISGRSLGHTGGTLDKLETIPGFNTQLSLGEFSDVLRRCHAALIGQTKTLVPADRTLYALRDHTGTVESPYLICASIMSKKLAEDLNALVLDVKTGSGAFMRRYEDSRLLADLMVATGERNGTRTVALLTTMDEPLGRFAGNWVEVWECVDILKNTPQSPDVARLSEDLRELTRVLSGWMLHLAGKAATPEAGATLADDLLRSGAAYNAWLKIVDAQGGDSSVFDDPAAFHKPAASRILRSDRAGYLAAMDCTEVGWAVQRLGAGRAKPGDPVSAHAGIEMHTKLGDRIAEGQPLVTLFAEDPALLDEPYAMLRATLQLADAPPNRSPLIHEIVQQQPAAS